MVMFLDQLGDCPFATSLLLDGHLGFTANSGNGTVALGGVVISGQAAAKALTGADNLAANDGAITARALVDADPSAESYAARIRVVEHAGGLFGIEFHSLVRFKIGVAIAAE
ncbi:hypothetical protein TorRG33x02_249800, partial [Trema orientale]